MLSRGYRGELEWKNWQLVEAPEQSPGSTLICSTGRSLEKKNLLLAGIKIDDSEMAKPQDKARSVIR